MKTLGKFLNTISNVQRIELSPIEVQRAMYKGNVKKSYSLNSSHTPNFSQPEKLAALLLEIKNAE